MFALRIETLTKVYSNGVLALDEMSMEVREGTVFGLLGPNGAGKSTLVKILVSLVRATNWQGQLLGRPLGDAGALRKIGYLPENPVWPQHLDAAALLAFAGRLHGLRGRALTKRVEAMLEVAGLGAWRRDKPHVFSKGMRQRLGLAYALMGDPSLVFLDEPTDGVDPVGRKEMRDIILDLRARGKTIFVNSHVLGELELMCDSVAILSRGRVVRQGTLEDLTMESLRYDVVVEGDAIHDTALVDLVRTLGGTITMPDASVSCIAIPTRRHHLIQPVVDEVRSRGYLIVSVAPARQSLEELFLESLRLSHRDPGRGTSKPSA
jgi:ABC-2 type transport system ATP-binding protein